MILDAIGKLVGGVGGVIDALHTSDEEKLQAKTALLALQAGTITEALDYEKQLAQAKAGIITAEAKSTHVLTATWRPITMLTFVFLIVYSQFTGMEIPPDLWFVVKLGLGGYVVGRSVEKVIPATAEALKAREQT